MATSLSVISTDSLKMDRWLGNNVHKNILARSNKSPWHTNHAKCYSVCLEFKYFFVFFYILQLFTKVTVYKNSRFNVSLLILLKILCLLLCTHFSVRLDLLQFLYSIYNQAIQQKVVCTI